MRLSELIQSSGLSQTIQTAGRADPEINSITDDSRAAGSDALFVVTEQGRPYLSKALEREDGPIAVLMGREGPELEANLTAGRVIARAEDVLAAQGDLASTLHGRPSRELDIVGITGTNGKTSIAHMVEHIWRESGKTYGIIGTLGVRYRGADGKTHEFKTGYTTPRAPRTHEILARMRDAGVDRVAMEVSSEGISLGRIEGVRFAAAIFSNLTRDHLDHHGTMEDYFQAKARLFHQTAGGGGRLIIHTGDEYGKRLADEMEAQYQVELDRVDGPDAMDLPVPARFYRMNGTLAARAVAPDITREDGRKALASLPPVPGRFNIVLPPWEHEPFNLDASRGPRTKLFGIVDYAHTPDALENVLREARGMGIATMVCLIGCGGDRDPGKRAPMGNAAARFADLVILTDDNPRSEDPELIRRAMLKGVHEEWERRMEEGDELPPELIEIGNRRFAIEAAVLWAMDHAGPTALILAGKGHETEQIFEHRREHFSDIEELEKAFLKFGDELQ